MSATSPGGAFGVGGRVGAGIDPSSHCAGCRICADVAGGAWNALSTASLPPAFTSPSTNCSPNAYGIPSKTSTIGADEAGAEPWSASTWSCQAVLCSS